MYAALREESLTGLTDIGFDGYAIGGLAVGEPEAERLAVLDDLMPKMPQECAALPDGRGYPVDIAEAVIARRRHVRLRYSDPPCTQWPTLHITWQNQVPARWLPG